MGKFARSHQRTERREREEERKATCSKVMRRRRRRAGAGASVASPTASMEALETPKMGDSAQAHHIESTFVIRL